MFNFNFFKRTETPKIHHPVTSVKNFEDREKTPEKTEEELSTEKIKNTKSLKELSEVLRKIEPIAATAILTGVIHFKKGNTSINTITEHLGIRSKVLELVNKEKEEAKKSGNPEAQNEFGHMGNPLNKLVMEAKSFEELYSIIRKQEIIVTGHGYVTAEKLIEQIKLARKGDFYINDITVMNNIRHKVGTLLNLESKQ